MRNSRYASWVWLGVLALVACNPKISLVADGGGGAGGAGPTPTMPALPGLKSIVVEPAELTLTIDGDAAATAMYKARGTFEDGKTEDITGKVAFSLEDPGLGGFTGAKLTTGVERGGASIVVASAGTVAGRGSLNVILRKRAVDTASMNVPADAATRFAAGTAAAARAPEIVYPADGVLFPPNLSRLEVHFLPGAGNTLFELAVTGDLVDVRVHMRCPVPMKNGCIYAMDPKVWRWIANTHRGRGPVKLTIKGSDDLVKEVGASAPLEVSFARDDIQGGIYYWTTSGGTGIMRYDFASATQTAAERYLGTELSGGTCIGCHALSREGKKMVAAAGTPKRGQLLLVEVARKTAILQLPAAPRSIFESWGPQDKQYVGVWGELDATNFNLLLFNGDTGQLDGMIDVGGTREQPISHPDWSPDGNKIAFTRAGIAALRAGNPRLQELYEGAIAMVSRPDFAGAWGAPVEIVPRATGRNRYYPAFAPDNGFIVFNESVCPDGQPSSNQCDADSDPTARLFAVQPRAGATPIELARANAGGKTDGGNAALTNSYPKWSPFVFQRTSEFGKRLLWLTFSSTRNYGLRDPPPSTELPRGMLLWMTAVDPDKVAAGADPSAPAFVLPFQDIATSNHIAQWTKKVVVIE